MKTLSYRDFIHMGDYSDTHPLKIDLMYASAKHPENNFGEALYKPDARLWLYKDFGEVVLKAAERIYREYEWVLVLKDGLRPVEAQEKMAQTEIIRQNPHWLKEPGMLVSPPGTGAHPRGMAIDLAVETLCGKAVDMGTSVDHFEDNAFESPAFRTYTKLPPEILERREALSHAFVECGKELGQEILPFPNEWWDYRYPREVYNRFAPVYEADFPESMRFVA